ncbi:spermidine synthase [Kitasatospora sp. NPDC001540]|uniref:spermidine synthase n=1 Tax=Kitasatospora sp. NPDC001540 TaxID=3364014 RepID=UPI00369B8E62
MSVLPALPVEPAGAALPSRQGLAEAEVLDRRESGSGEVVLRRRGEHCEVIVNGCFLMDTVDGRSERLLVAAALDGLAAVERPSVLIGGLGVGFSLAHAAAEPRWGRIAVVEREAAIIDWHRTGPLGAFSAGALDDPRVEVLHTDLVAYLAQDGERYDALCLDIDNGPDWTVGAENDRLYGPSGLARAAARLNSGGVLAVWSAQPSAAFERALRAAGFTDVRTEEIPVERGVPDVVHLARRA